MKKFIMFFMLIVSLLFLTGCASHKTSATSEVFTKYISTTDTLVRHDSIIVRDSINREVFIKGDTVNILTEKFRIEYRDRIKEKIHTDTIHVTDTLIYYSEVAKGSDTSMPTSVGFVIYMIFALLIGVLMGILTIKRSS